MSLCMNGVLHVTHDIAYPKESHTIETSLCPYMSVVAPTETKQLYTVSKSGRCHIAAPATEEPLQHTAQ